jgi:hypothetical protein
MKSKEERTHTEGSEVARPVGGTIGMYTAPGRSKLPKLFPDERNDVAS